MKKLEDILKLIEKDLNNVRASVYKDDSTHSYILKFDCVITGTSFNHRLDASLVEEEYILTDVWKRTKTEILLKRGEHYSKLYPTPTSFTPSWSPSTPSPSSYTWYSTSPIPTTTTTVTSGPSIIHKYEDVMADFETKLSEATSAKIKVKPDIEEYRKVKNYGLF